ncbi:hypothetical protein AnigIFM62618_005311 [Aspergillus niger]|nr:hypothetical protein AnigIFM62618_005311 [Aspergillus niger]
MVNFFIYSISYLLATANADLVAADVSQAFLDPAYETPANTTRKWQDIWAFSGIVTFAHLPHVACLAEPRETFDIAIIGAPFDTSVSYRPGSRFGPKAIRSASMRQTPSRSFHPQLGVNPYQNWAKVVDCGDIPLTPYDNNLAMSQLTHAFQELAERSTQYQDIQSQFPTFGGTVDLEDRAASVARLVTLGGDHSVILGALRALKEIHGPITLIHFDSHLDTWSIRDYPSSWPKKSAATFTHGSMLWVATQEGLIANDSSIHAGLRCRLSGTDYKDYDADEALGFRYIEAFGSYASLKDATRSAALTMTFASEMESLGPRRIAQIIARRAGHRPVYLSIDIDVIDPAQAPGTGTPESGGWSTREMRILLQQLAGLNIVGADVVEVAPAYDVQEITALAAADLVHELVSLMVLSRIDSVDQKWQRQYPSQKPWYGTDSAKQS